MKFADRLKFTATGTSAATITFSAAVTACRTPAQAIADGALTVGDTGVPFTVTDGTAWEDSLFTVTSSTVLTRTSVLASSAGGTTAATFSGPLTVFNATPGSYLTGQTVNALPDATLASGMYLLVTDASGNAFRASLSALQSFLGTTGTPSESLTVNNPGAQTAAVAFSVSGTYSNASTTPSALDYSINGGSTWSAAATPTITPTATGAGTFSFGGVTVPSANASQTVMVRDHLNQTVTATSASFAVSAASTPATALTMTGPTSGAVSVASTNFTVSLSPGGGTISGTTAVTPNDGGAGGTFTPTTLSLTTAAPSGTFTYTPNATAGAKTISITNSGTTTLSNPASITYTASAAVTPTLSNATATATSSTAASYSVTTNEANGTLYRLFSTNATETATTIKAANLTQTVTTAGAQTGNTTVALNPTTTYYGHFVYVDGAGVTSAVANTASFATPAAGTMASTYIARIGVNSAQLSNAATTMTVNGNGDKTATEVVRINIKDASGNALTPGNVKFVWGLNGNCPTTYAANGLPASSTNGNSGYYPNGIASGTRLGSWQATDTDASNSFYGTFDFSVGAYVAGSTPSPTVLTPFLLYSDGSVAVFTNNTGNAANNTWTLS